MTFNPITFHYEVVSSRITSAKLQRLHGETKEAVNDSERAYVITSSATLGAQFAYR